MRPSRWRGEDDRARSLPGVALRAAHPGRPASVGAAALDSSASRVSERYR